MTLLIVRIAILAIGSFIATSTYADATSVRDIFPRYPGCVDLNTYLDSVNWNDHLQKRDLGPPGNESYWSLDSAWGSFRRAEIGEFLRVNVDRVTPDEMESARRYMLIKKRREFRKFSVKISPVIKVAKNWKGIVVTTNDFSANLIVELVLFSSVDHTISEFRFIGFDRYSSDEDIRSAYADVLSKMLPCIAGQRLTLHSTGPAQKARAGR